MRKATAGCLGKHAEVIAQLGRWLHRLVRSSPLGLFYRREPIVVRSPRGCFSNEVTNFPAEIGNRRRRRQLVDRQLAQRWLAHEPSMRDFIRACCTLSRPRGPVCNYVGRNRFELNFICRSNLGLCEADSRPCATSTLCCLVRLVRRCGLVIIWIEMDKDPDLTLSTHRNERGTSPNHSIKPTSPTRNNTRMFATTPCGGLSLSR